MIIEERIEHAASCYGYRRLHVLPEDSFTAGAHFVLKEVEELVEAFEYVMGSMKNEIISRGLPIEKRCLKLKRKRGR